TLAPANARYARIEVILAGRERLATRERSCTAKPTEIAAIAGQNTLVSHRVSFSAKPRTVYPSGEIVVANRHTKIGTIVHPSINALGVGPLDAAREPPRKPRARLSSDIGERTPWRI